MIQKTIKFFVDKIYSKRPKKDYTNVYHIDDIGSLDIIGLKDNGPQNDRSFGYVLVVIDNFSKFGWTVPLKNTKAQTINASIEKKRYRLKKPNLVEPYREKEFWKFFFKHSLKKYS